MLDIFYSVNASLYLTNGRTALLIDGIHNGRAEGFSAMPEGMMDRIMDGTGMFERLDGLLFTHLHQDHYDETAVRAVMARRPELALWGPQMEPRGLSDQRDIPGGEEFRIGDFRIFAYQTDHSGKVFADEVHYSFLIRDEWSGEQIFVGGDAVFSPELAERVTEDAGGAGTVDAAVLMIYQLIEKPSIAFLTRLAPKRLLMYHHPLKEDPAYQDLKEIYRYLERNPLSEQKVEYLEHMKWVKIE